MKVRIRQRAGYGDRYGVFHEMGAVVDYPDHIALKLIKNGTAEAVRETPIERATIAAPETTEKGALTTKAFSPRKARK